MFFMPSGSSLFRRFSIFSSSFLPSIRRLNLPKMLRSRREPDFSNRVRNRYDTKARLARVKHARHTFPGSGNIFSGFVWCVCGMMTVVVVRCCDFFLWW